MKLNKSLFYSLNESILVIVFCARVLDYNPPKSGKDKEIHSCLGQTLKDSLTTFSVDLPIPACLPRFSVIFCSHFC